MTNKQLQELLKTYPDDIKIKILPTHQDNGRCGVADFSDEHTLLTSTTAHLNSDVPEDEWDNEDGKIELGDGERYLLINPIIY